MQQVQESVSINGGVVVGYDGSEAALGAVRWAIDDARRRGATLHVVRAWTLPQAIAQVEHPYGSVPSLGEIEQALRESTSREIGELPATGVDVDVHICHGHTTRVLMQAASGADLLVVASRGRGGFTGLLLGSTAEQLVRHSPCTVAVVRG